MDYKDENTWLMLGDCLERMSEIHDGSVDLTVTSPPYDNMRTYNGNNALWGEHVWEAVIKDLYRVTTDGGVVVWVVGDATTKGSETGTSFKQVIHAMHCGFNLHDTMIWEKTGSGALGSQLCYGQNFEYMFVLSKGKPNAVNLICDRENVVKSGKVTVNSSLTADKKATTRIVERKPFGKRTNIWRIQPQQKSDHPAPFPEALARDHILSWSNEGDTVFDPFLGSGTTGKMARLLNRRFIGVEMDEGYFEIAKKRILKGGCIMFKDGDVVVCTDTSGFSDLEVEVGKEYVVESVHNMCYIRLVGVFDMQKMWRFKLKGSV